jgi:hypothetical protein
MRAVANCDAIQQVARRRKLGQSEQQQQQQQAGRRCDAHGDMACISLFAAIRSSSWGIRRIIDQIYYCIYISDACMRFGHRSPRCYKAKAKLVDPSGNASTLSPATASTPGGFVPSMHLRLPSSSIYYYSARGK